MWLLVEASNKTEKERDNTMIKSRLEVYREIVKERHIIEMKEPIDPLVPDQAMRRANLHALRTTEAVFQEQFKKGK